MTDFKNYLRCNALEKGFDGFCRGAGLPCHGALHFAGRCGFTRDYGKIMRRREVKRPYAGEVYLTEREYGQLTRQAGADTWRCLRILNDYKLKSGAKYASDYSAIVSWVLRAARREARAERQACARAAKGGRL